MTVIQLTLMTMQSMPNMTNGTHICTLQMEISQYLTIKSCKSTQAMVIGTKMTCSSCVIYTSMTLIS